jgi:hypothetical protein
VRGIVCEYPSFATLDNALAEGKREQEVDLPCCEAVTDGEWLVITIVVGAESTTIAGRAEDRGHGIRLTFTKRDWERLEEFSQEGGPPSLPPVSPPSIPHPVHAAPGTRALIVDDDLSLQTIVGTMLEASGISAVRAGSAEEAYDVMALAPVVRSSPPLSSTGRSFPCAPARPAATCGSTIITSHRREVKAPTTFSHRSRR